MDIRLLRADEIDVRVGGFNKEKTGGFLLLYKDARVDMAILDEMFGIYGWKRKHETINGNLFCTISIYDKETKQWIEKQDVGIESQSDKTKGEASDSFKRAGFNIGIGRELYTAPFIWINGLSKYDKFKVEEIEYNEKREITQLTIVDKKGIVAFTKKANSKPVYEIKQSDVKVMEGLLTKLGKEYTDTILKHYNIKSISELPQNQFGKLLQRIKTKIEEGEK